MAMKKRGGLGSGMSSLFSSNEIEEKHSGGVLEVPDSQPDMGHRQSLGWVNQVELRFDLAINCGISHCHSSKDNHPEQGSVYAVDYATFADFV